MARKKKPYVRLTPMSDAEKAMWLKELDEAEVEVISAHAELESRRREHEILTVKRDALRGAIETLRERGLIPVEGAS